MAKVKFNDFYVREEEDVAFMQQFFWGERRN